jgi:hypothetical protein
MGLTDGNPWSAVASGLTSGLTLVIRVCEFTYAMRAVDQQTFAYLKTAEHVSDNIKAARQLRRKRSGAIADWDKKEFDRIINQTEVAVKEVAILLEPARVDLDADQKIKFTTRGLWVLQKNANITAALNQMQAFNVSLNQTIHSLRTIRDLHLTPDSRSDKRSTLPPAYSRSNLLHYRQRSRTNLRHQGSTESFQTVQTARSDDMEKLPCLVAMEEINPNDSRHSSLSTWTTIESDDGGLQIHIPTPDQRHSSLTCVSTSSGTAESYDGGLQINVTGHYGNEFPPLPATAPAPASASASTREPYAITPPVSPPLPPRQGSSASYQHRSWLHMRVSGHYGDDVSPVLSGGSVVSLDAMLPPPPPPPPSPPAAGVPSPQQGTGGHRSWLHMQAAKPCSRSNRY